jgi:hypothetical protein
MLSSLVKTIQGNSTEVAQPRKQLPARKTQILRTPSSFLVKEDYIGVNHKFLVAKLGDRVVVHAWVDTENGEEVAVAFNERNNTAGWIPSNVLEVNDFRRVLNSEILMAHESYQGEPHHGRFLTWNSGDHIRLCRYQYGSLKSSGIGFNMVTGQIGRYEMKLACFSTIKS